MLRTISVCLLVLMLSTPAGAVYHHYLDSDWGHDPRAMLEVNHSRLTGGGEQRIHVRCPNLMDQPLNCLAFLGFNYRAGRGQELEPALGFNFQRSEWIAALSWTGYNGPDLERSQFYSWIDLEARPQSLGSFYYFAQSEIRALEWVDFGLEAEGWDEPGSPSSHGLGINCLVHLRGAERRNAGALVDVDFAVHYRWQPKELGQPPEWAPELSVRVHITPDLEL